MTKQVEVLYTKTKHAVVPTQGYEEDFCYDMYSSKGVLVPPMTFKSVIIPTDFITAFDPKDVGMKVSLRSGVSAKTPLVMSNAPGIVEGTYRKGIGIIVRNAFIDNRLVDFAFTEEGKRIKVKDIPKEVLRDAHAFYEGEMELLELQPTVEVGKQIYKTLVPAGTIYIAKNRRVAQMHFQDKIEATFTPSKKLPNSDRGAKGIGSSGSTVSK